MRGIKSLQTLEEREAFAEILADPERMGLSVKQIADKFGFSIGTIYNRLDDPEIKALFDEKRKERIRLELPAIDKAMIERAKSGDVKAAALVYQRWDGWTPKNIVQTELGIVELPAQLNAEEWNAQTDKETPIAIEAEVVQ